MTTHPQIDFRALNLAAASARRAFSALGQQLLKLRKPILIADLRQGDVRVIACRHDDMGRAWTEMQMRAARWRRARGTR